MPANVSLKASARFDFKLPDEWPQLRRRHQQYLTARGLDKEDDARKVSTLLYCLGEESDDVLTATNISEHERENDEAVIEKFDTFFKGRRHERARNNRKDQMERESEKCITCLYGVVETCEYGHYRVGGQDI